MGGGVLQGFLEAAVGRRHQPWCLLGFIQSRKVLSTGLDPWAGPSWGRRVPGHLLECPGLDPGWYQPQCRGVLSTHTSLWSPGLILGSPQGVSRGPGTGQEFGGPVLPREWGQGSVCGCVSREAEHGPAGLCGVQRAGLALSCSTWPSPHCGCHAAVSQPGTASLAEVLKTPSTTDLLGGTGA